MATKAKEKTTKNWESKDRLYYLKNGVSPLMNKKVQQH